MYHFKRLWKTFWLVNKRKTGQERKVAKVKEGSFFIIYEAASLTPARRCSDTHGVKMEITNTKVATPITHAVLDIADTEILPSCR